MLGVTVDVRRALIVRVGFVYCSGNPHVGGGGLLNILEFVVAVPLR